MAQFYETLGINMKRENHKVYINPAKNFLIEEAVRKGYGRLSTDGALLVNTGKHTGRSAKDKYVVKSESTNKTIWWDNNLNEMTSETFAKIKTKVISYLNREKDLYITEKSVGAHEVHNIGVRTISTHPQHALFTNHLFRGPQRDFNDKDFTILHAPELKLDPAEFGLRSDACVTTCFDTKTTIICGTLYAGEIKKSMFCVLNYVLPESNILPMHAGASKNNEGETSVFFGLSGTGKTTLSTDEGMKLVGDDEHGLSDEGIFNFEGGCYAKTYKLSHESEPGIYEASNRFGAMLENVMMTCDHKIDFYDNTITENGRSSYPLEFIDDLEPSSRGKIPRNIFFLTADAFGVLPPVAKLTKEQAMFYFVLGYTSKLAGTEIGVTEPQATFSACFGAPFMLRNPKEYAALLGKYLDKYDINVWLVNTGWTGGAYGEGHRFPIKVTRQIIRSIQNHKLDKTDTHTEEIFGLKIPNAVDGIEDSVLNPRESWKDQEAFDTKARELAQSFHKQMQGFGEFYDENAAGAPLFK